MRKNRVKQIEIYHVSGKCSGIRWPDMPMDHIWLMFTNHIAVIKKHYKINPLAFVLMDNHFHFLCEAYRGDIDTGLNYLKQAMEGTFTLIDYWDTLFENNKLFAKKILNNAQFLETYKYIYRNPVGVGLVIKAEHYRFSSLHSILNGKNMLGCEDPLHIIYDPFRVLNWINGKSKNLYFPQH